MNEALVGASFFYILILYDHCILSSLQKNIKNGVEFTK